MPSSSDDDRFRGLDKSRLLDELQAMHQIGHLRPKSEDPPPPRPITADMVVRHARTLARDGR